MNIPPEWKPSASNNGGLFRIIKTGNLAKSFECVERVKNIVLDSAHRDNISMTISADFITITLDNYTGMKQILLEDFIVTARLINTQLDTASSYRMD